MFSGVYGSGGAVAIKSGRNSAATGSVKTTVAQTANSEDTIESTLSSPQTRSTPTFESSAQAQHEVH